MSSKDNKKPRKFFKANKGKGEAREPKEGPTKAEAKITLQLNSTDPTHLNNWAEQVGLKANTLFPKLASVIITSKYPKVELPTTTTIWDETNDPSGIKRALLTNEIKRYGDKLDKLEVAKSALFSEMLSSMSEKSVLSVKVFVHQETIKDAIKDWENSNVARNKALQEMERRAILRSKIKKAKAQAARDKTPYVAEDNVVEPPRNDDDLDVEPLEPLQHPTTDCAWDDFKVDADPLKLWEAIKDTHTVRKSTSEAQDRNMTVAAFWDLKMKASQTLDRYYEIWNTTVRGVKATGGEIPKGKDLVVRFVTSLDSGRWGRMQAEFQNRDASFDEEIRKKAYPSTVDEAYVIASNRKEASSSAAIGEVGPMALVTVAKERTHNKPYQSKRGREDRADHRTDDTTHAHQDKRKKAHFTNDTKRAPSKPCGICNGAHWQSDCPYLSDVKELVKERSGSTHMICLAVKTKSTESHATPSRPDTAVVIDNASDVHIFNNKELLTDIVKCARFELSGISASGPKIIVTSKGRFNGIENVFYSEEAAANVLSQGLLEDHYVLTYKQGHSIKVTISNDNDLTFYKSGRRYYFEARNKAFLSSVQENEKGYSAREVEQARKAKDLIQVLNYPGKHSLIRGLKAGNINNVQVTVEDVNRAYDIYGKDIAALRGKSTRPSPSERDHELGHTSRRGVAEIGTLSVDIMTIDSNMFIIGVLDEIPITMSTHITNRSAATILGVLQSMKDMCAKHGWDVIIRSDNEKSLVAIAEKLRVKAVDMDIELVAPGRHVPIVERKIRTIKERVRGIINTLPYTLPLFLIKWMVSSVVCTLNMLRDDSNHNPVDDLRSPRERFFGRRVDAKRDLRIAFGKYAEIYDVNNTQINSMKPRTRGAIALAPTGSASGTMRFWCLSTNRIVRRDSWTELPINKDITDLITLEAHRRGRATIDPAEEEIGHDTAPNTVNDVVTVNEEAGPPVTANAAENIDDDSSVESESDDGEHDAAPKVEELLETATPDMVSDIEATPPVNVTDIAPTITSDISDTTAIETHQPQRRYPSRDRKKSHKVFTIKVNDALNKFGKKALKSIVGELVSLMDYKCFTPVNINKLGQKDLKKILRSTMFLKEKYLANGEFEKLKARLVAGGDRQDRSIYTSEETSSPTVSTWALFALATLSARRGAKVTTVDIKSAYLNARITSKDILMRIEPSLAAMIGEIEPKWKEAMSPNGSLVVKLDKALYGCVESARLFYEHLKDTLKSIGFSCSKIDPGVFYKTNQDGKRCFLVTHVDDIMIFSDSSEQRNEVINQLEKVYKSITVNDGEVHNYTGMVFDFSKKGSVVITMTGFVSDMLAGCEGVGVAKTPANADLYRVDENSLRLEKHESEKFHRIVMQLMYLSKRTRPDILTAVSFLATRVQESTKQDMGKLMRVVNYINHTKHLPLTLEADKGTVVIVEAYVDAAHGVHRDLRGHTGATLSLGRGSILAKSSKQRLTAKSSCEAEIIGVSDFLSQIMQIVHLLAELGLQTGPAKLHQDNTSTIKLLQKGRPASDATRHIAIRFFFAKDYIDKGELTINYCPTDAMLADVLTKPLVGRQFLKHRHKLLNLDGELTNGGVLRED